MHTHTLPGYTSNPESSASANRPNTTGANVQQVRQQHVVTVTPPRSSRSDTEGVQAPAQQETRTMPHKQGTPTHEHQENSAAAAAAAAAAPAGPPNDDNQSYNFSSDDNDSDLVRALEESLALAREKERTNKKRLRDIDKKRPALNENMLKKPPHGNQAMEKVRYKHAHCVQTFSTTIYHSHVSMQRELYYRLRQRHAQLTGHVMDLNIHQDTTKESSHQSRKRCQPISQRRRVA